MDNVSRFDAHHSRVDTSSPALTWIPVQDENWLNLLGNNVHRLGPLASSWRWTNNVVQGLWIK